MGEVIVPLLIGAGSAAAGAAISKATAPKPQAVKAPPVAAVQAPPSTTDTTQAGEQSRKQTTSTTDRSDTFLTGDLVPKTKKKKLLG